VATSIFLHIPKTGGTTLRQLMTLNYNSDQVLSIYGSLSSVILQCREEISTSQKPSLIQGHIPYGVHRFMNIRTANYFAFMRQPVYQLYSDIQYSIERKGHGLHRHFKDSGGEPETWASIAGEFSYYRNNQCHYLSGTFFSQEVTLAGLNQAIDNLWKCKFVGVFDFYEESVLILAKYLGWSTVIGEKLNVAKNRVNLTEEMKAAGNSLVEYDNVLYAVALDMFETERKKYGALLDEAAEQLRGVRLAQSELEPSRLYDRHMVGDKVDLNHYGQSIGVTKGSPIDIWLKSDE